MIISLKTEVDFAIPGIGKLTETYDANSANDMACWYANAKLYPQIHARTLEQIELDPDDDDDKLEIERFAAIKAKAREQARELTRLRMN